MISMRMQNDNAHFTLADDASQKTSHSSARSVKSTNSAKPTTSSTSTTQHCPLCKKEISYLTTDLRPVFPQERLLLEFLLKKEPFAFASSSVWNSANRYYIDSKTVSISTKDFNLADTDFIQKQLNMLHKKILKYQNLTLTALFKNLF